jgi:hypothetical protein
VAPSSRDTPCSAADSMLRPSLLSSCCPAASGDAAACAADTKHSGQ